MKIARRKSFIRLKGGFKINYTDSTKEEIYLIIEEPTEERRNFLKQFFDKYSIVFNELGVADFKVYWHGVNWLQFADLLEEEV